MSLHEVTLELRGFPNEESAKAFTYGIEKNLEEALDSMGITMNVRVVKSQEPDDELQ